jgi:AraC family transcriptional regulator
MNSVSHSTRISNSILHEGLPSERGSKSSIAGLNEIRLQLAGETIRERLSETMDVSTLSSIVGLSRSHFSRTFRKALGEPPHAHICRLRIDRAMKLMRESDSSLSQIALAVGFSDQAHFSNIFRRATGATPSQWRKSQLAIDVLL